MEATDEGDERTLDGLRAVCLAFPEAEETSLQDRPLFVVRRRRFALFNGVTSPSRPRWAGCGRSVHLLTDPEDRAALAADDRFVPSPHHGDRGWVAVAPDVIAPDELAELLEAAYRVAAPRSLVARLDQVG